jgi:hypothetical protein
MYRWACHNKILPKVNAIGKSLNYPRMVSDWSPEEVATAFHLLMEPSTNGQPH